MDKTNFTRTPYQGLDGSPKIVFQHESGDFQMIASKQGLLLKGALDIPNMEALQNFAKVLSGAWQDADRFKKKLKSDLTTNERGH